MDNRGRVEGRNSRENTYKYKFEQRFGKPIDEFTSFKIATETLSPKSVENYHKVLPAYFLFLDEDPDTVIAHRSQHHYVTLLRMRLSTPRFIIR